MDIEKIFQEKARLIDSEIGSVFPRKSRIAGLYEAVWYHLGAGGKRLRPLLAIMTFEALGGDSKKILPFAASCEILHNWLLVHDDIEDGDRMRRDKPALWVKYGLAHGINTGDLMSQKVFELILKSNEGGLDEKTTLKLVNAMVTAAVRTAEGQAMDINLRNNDSPSEKQYMEMATGKTAHYLTLPMAGAAIAAGREDIVPKLTEFGMHIGPAFQIADDILDLTRGKGRGETGRDIKEGKRSMLVVHCLSRCSAAEKKKIVSILNKPPEKTTKNDVDYAKRLFARYKSIDYARKMAESLSAKAKKAAPKELEEILYFFADYLVKRDR